MQTFEAFGLAAPILRSLEQEGYTHPTPVQAESIAPAMADRDVLACAQTGTGKTAAFLLPIIHRLLETPRAFRHQGIATPRALVLSPTRELASQIADSFATYARHTHLKETTVVGGVSQHRQERALARGCDLLVATPGRLQDLMNQRIVDLGSIDVFVLDEADRMLDMGFIQPIRQIASAIPQSRQTLMFSATMPRAIAELARSLLNDPVRVTVEKKVETARLIEQMVYQIDKPRKQSLLHHLLIQPGVDRAIVFTRTKHGAERLSKNLEAAGFDCTAIHGNKTQRQRERALDAFRHGDCTILVATDVAARGLDVDGVTHVFNYELPDDAESYVHRIGRTGRAGAKGIAIAFCDPAERKLLRAVEAEIGARVPIAELPPRSNASGAPAPRPATPEVQAPRAEQRAERRPAPQAQARDSRPHAKPSGPKPGPRPDAGAPAKPRAKHHNGASHAAHPLPKAGPKPADRRPTAPGAKGKPRVGSASSGAPFKTGAHPKAKQRPGQGVKKFGGPGRARQA